MDVRGRLAFLNRHFRRRRMQRFVTAMGITAQSRVLDVGGSPGIWDVSPVVPQLTFLNLVAGDDERSVVGDARALDYSDRSFDVAFSNSVIEHVGEAEDQARFAAEIRRVARGYWVQTPNRRFVVEPHYLALGVHWLPRRVQRRVLRWTSVWGWTAKPSQESVDAHVEEIRLLDRPQLRRLFPDAELLPERTLGLTKAWVAQRVPLP